MGKDIGIDLGTATVLVYVKGKGILMKEPSVVAIDKKTDKIVRVGKEAEDMIGRTPGNVTAIRPLRDGVINQYDLTLHMIQYFLRKACGPLIFKPRVIICVPSGISEVEERAVVDAATNAGAKVTYLIEEPVAAALGAGIEINDSQGHMIVDIGGGTTDIAVLSLGGIVVSQSIKVAGDKFDEAIMRYVRKKHNVLIGERTAELIKIKIGNAWPMKEQTITVKGQCLVQGLPRTVTLSSSEMPDALEEPITAVVEAICGVIEKTPPELVGDILRNGIIMTGGGSLLHGFDRLITYATGINTIMARNPILCVVRGTGMSLDSLGRQPSGSVKISGYSGNDTHKSFFEKMDDFIGKN